MTSLQASLSHNVLHLILQHLTRREASQLSAVCRDLRALVCAAGASKCTFRARLIVVASETNTLLDLCPKTGEILYSARIQRWALRKHEKLSSYWPTGVALSPYDGDYYVCQYKGRCILQFRGFDLAFRRVAAKLPSGYTNPEGICFSKKCLYVACATPGVIWRFSESAITGLYEPISRSSMSYYPMLGLYPYSQYAHVPWGMAAGPGGNVYIAMEEEYEDLKNLPFHHKNGLVVVAKLTEQGEFLGLKRFCGLDERLCRPSGVSFDDEGNLFVTSLTNEVLMYKGPLSENPGEFIRVAASWDFGNLRRGAGALLPWDVRWHPGIPGIGNGPILLVTRHTDIRNRSKSCISIICAETGKELRTIQSKSLRKGNMMAME